jgi:hypothetical protein
VTLFYPDVANVNWDDSGTGVPTPAGTQNLLNFLSGLQAQGFAGVAHKMSQGATFIDGYGAICQTWCAQNAFPFTGYHYLSTEDPNAQAANWLAAGGGSNMMSDHEDGGGDLDNFWAVVNSFNSVNVNAQILYEPNWYWASQGSGDLSGLASNGIYLVSSGYPGGSGFASDIYAASGGDTGEGFVPYGGATPAAWQFTNQANVGGFTVDVNAYLGTDINVLFGTATVAPPAPPVAPVATFYGLPIDDNSIYPAIPSISAQFGA